jgi:hypothetical protein
VGEGRHVAPDLVSTATAPELKAMITMITAEYKKHRNRDRHSPGYMRDYMAKRRAKKP